MVCDKPSVYSAAKLNLFIYLFMYIFMKHTLYALFFGALVSAAIFVPVSATTQPSNALDRLKNAGVGAYGAANEEKYSKAGAFEQTVGGIINVGLTLVGVVFLVLTVYGGYIWMIARGDESEAKKAKDIIIMATLGLLVVISAYAITNFIVGKLLTSTVPTTSSQ